MEPAKETEELQVRVTVEQQGWENSAAAADEGRGVPFQGVDLNDMQEVYEALNVTGLAKTRLRAYIQRLQAQAQPKQQDVTEQLQQGFAEGGELLVGRTARLNLDDSRPATVGDIKQFVRQALEETKTESAIMSKAKADFTHQLLSDLNYKISMKPDRPGTAQNHVFDWAPSEEARTPAAAARLSSLMDPDQMAEPLEFVPVTGCKLRDVKKGKRKATGKSDLRVAKRGWKPPTDNAFSQAIGLVELKVGTNTFTEAQLHLELVSVAMSSVFRQGVALLATDCLTRWGVWSFESKNTISGVWYVDSREAIGDYKEMVASAQARCDARELPSIEEHEEESDHNFGGQGGDTDRKGGQGGGSRKRPPRRTTSGGFRPPPKKPDVQENMVSTLYEQELSGFDEISETELDAFEREQFLAAFASALRNETGEECSVPTWARAHDVS